MAAVLPVEVSFDTSFLVCYVSAIIHALHVAHAVSLTETYTVQHDILSVKALVEAQNQTVACEQVRQAHAARTL